MRMIYQLFTYFCPYDVAISFDTELVRLQAKIKKPENINYVLFLNDDLYMTLWWGVLTSMSFPFTSYQNGCPTELEVIGCVE